MRSASIGFNYISSLTGKFNQITEGWRIHHYCLACGVIIPCAAVDYTA